jgi:hypothetical protein
VPGRSWPTTSGIAKRPSGLTLPPLTARWPKYSKNAARGGPWPLISTGSPGAHVRASDGVGVIANAAVAGAGAVAKGSAVGGSGGGAIVRVGVSGEAVIVVVGVPGSG